MENSVSELHRLARLCGLQTSYYDVSGRLQEAAPESLLSVMRALGHEVHSPDDAPRLCADREQARWQRGMEPVVVLWEGEHGEFRIHLREDRADSVAECTFQLESGETRRHETRLSDCRTVEQAEVRETRYVAKMIGFPEHIPPGYHRLSVDAGDLHTESFLICAPLRAYSPPDTTHRRGWGTFLPLYSLQTEGSLGTGNYSDLERLSVWTGQQGGTVVGTLPLLSQFLSEPFEPSPYAPSTRLFWNEFYVDLRRIPEFQSNEEARRVLDAAGDRREQLRSGDYVNYRHQFDLTREVLELLAESFFEQKPAERWGEFQEFLANRPLLADFARFRAAREKLVTPWWEWPEDARHGELKPEHYGAQAERYYLYSQWIAAGQLGAIAHGKDGRAGLYLDLPLGVRQDGFDVWRYPRTFIVHGSAGAPPDALFTKGQDWGFSPLHPEGVREDNYAYVIAYLRHHMKYSSLLRLDHVMGLHRLYCVPPGMNAQQGVYVQYQADEFYAILNLESHRHQVSVIGENLGTVPAEVQHGLARHNVRPMYVVQYELNPPNPPQPPAVPADCLATVNTHDMPMFAGWWIGADIVDRHDLGLINEDEAARERSEREGIKEGLSVWLEQQGLLEPGHRSPDGVLAGLLKYLAASPAHVVLVNLEDLWQETRPQNIPGTHLERPNWRRRAKHRFEEFSTMPQVLQVLQEVNRLRQGS